MKQTGFCKTPWALNPGAPRSILRAENEKERKQLARREIRQIIREFGYPANSCYLPLKNGEWEKTVSKSGTVKTKKYKVPATPVFGYGDEDEAWLLFWQSIPD